MENFGLNCVLVLGSESKLGQGSIRRKVDRRKVVDEEYLVEQQ